MNNLTLFEALFLTHLIMDWIFQWRWEAMNKSHLWRALFFHCFVYTVGFIPVFILYSVNLWWLFLLFGSHVFFDKRSFENWLLEKFKGFRKTDSSESRVVLLTGVDQTLHIIILGIITIFS